MDSLVKRTLFSKAALGIAAHGVLAACGVPVAASHAPPLPPPPPSASAPRAAPTFAGVASYDDGRPAAGALILATNLKTGVRAQILITNNTEHFEDMLTPSTYAINAATAQDFAQNDPQAFQTPAP